MKKLFLIFVLMATPALAQNTQAFQGACTVGGVKVVTQGMPSSNTVQGSFPKCTVTVYLTGTQNLATIYKDGLNTPLGNPFTANSDGSWLYYALNNACYDIVMTGTMPQPVTLTDACRGSGGGGSGPTLQTNGTNNTSQTLLNLISGTNTTVTNTSGGTVRIDSTASGNPAVGPSGTVQVSDGAGHNAAGTAANIGNAMRSLYLAPSYMFGDSTTQGVGCSSYETCQAGLLTNAHGGPSYNTSLTGGMAANAVINVAKTLNPAANTSLPQYMGVVNIGINDAAGCGGTDVTCQQNYTAEQNAIVALFELTGSTYQTLAPACTLTGSWTSDTTNFAGGPYIGKVSTTNGNSFSCTITTTGNGIGLETVVQAGDGGTASCQVDGGTPQTVNFFPFNTTMNTTYTIQRTPEFAAAAGTHTLSCTITSATSASNPVEFIAVDSIPVGQMANLPFLVETNVVSNGGTNDTASLDISNLVLPIVTAFQTEGANVVYADIRTPTNNPNDFAANVAGCPTNSVNSSGGLHYNDCGHRAVFNAIQQAAPNAFQVNIGRQSYGDVPSPFRAHGNLIPSMTSGSGQSGGNFSFASSFGTTGVWPGMWCVFGNYCYGAGFNPGFIIPGANGNTQIQFINTNIFCFTQNNTATVTGYSSYMPPSWCLNGGGDLYGYFPNAGSPQKKYIHPGGLSRDDQTSYTGGSAGLTEDVTFVGPLTASSTITLGNCKDSGATHTIRNIEYTVYRHGTDGFPITFQAGINENINGGALGNSYTWSASEGDGLTIQCSAAQVGGSYWTISSNQADAGTLSGTTLNSTIVNSSLQNLGTLTKLSTNSIAGTGSASFALGAAAQVGTGATTPVCAAGYSCNSISGLVQFTTGTGTLAPGAVLTITTGVTRTASPACSITTNSATYIGANATANTTTVTVNAAVALAPSTSYNVVYNCGGN